MALSKSVKSKGVVLNFQWLYLFKSIAEVDSGLICRVSKELILHSYSKS